MTLTVEWERDDRAMVRCDHAGTTEPLDGSDTISVCTECAKTWPTRLGAGAATVRVVSKDDDAASNANSRKNECSATHPTSHAKIRVASPTRVASTFSLARQHAAQNFGSASSSRSIAPQRSTSNRRAASGPVTLMAFAGEARYPPLALPLPMIGTAFAIGVPSGSKRLGRKYRARVRAGEAPRGGNACSPTSRSCTVATARGEGDDALISCVRACARERSGVVGHRRREGAAVERTVAGAGDRGGSWFS